MQKTDETPVAAESSGAAGSRPFAVTNRLVLSIAVPMTLAYLSTPLLGLTDTAVVKTGNPLQPFRVVLASKATPGRTVSRVVTCNDDEPEVQ